jgi:RNA polymerase sigma-70 factor (ECF subfamily)
MQNVVAINAAARQSIVAAQATSDEMLLESIADGNRTAMHILYSRHNVRVYRFILRIASSKAARRFPPGCCRSRASRR